MSFDLFAAIEKATREWKLAHQPINRPCTCHPSEAPVPCQQKYALSECVSAAEPTYWDEKKKDRREEFKKEMAEDRERVDAGFPRDRP